MTRERQIEILESVVNSNCTKCSAHKVECDECIVKGGCSGEATRDMTIYSKALNKLKLSTYLSDIRENLK